MANQQVTQLSQVHTPTGQTALLLILIGANNWFPFYTQQKSGQTDGLPRTPIESCLHLTLYDG